jgi:hypothetical protein
MLLKNIMTTFLFALFYPFSLSYYVPIRPRRNELNGDSILMTTFFYYRKRKSARPDFHFVCPGTHKSMGFGKQGVLSKFALWWKDLSTV